METKLQETRIVAIIDHIPNGWVLHIQHKFKVADVFSRINIFDVPQARMVAYLSVSALLT